MGSVGLGGGGGGSGLVAPNLLDLSSWRVHSSLVIVTELQTATHELFIDSAGDGYQLLS